MSWGDHQQLLDAGIDEVLGLAHHVADRAADEIATQDGMMQKVQRWLQPSRRSSDRRSGWA